MAERHWAGHPPTPTSSHSYHAPPSLTLPLEGGREWVEADRITSPLEGEVETAGNGRTSRVGGWFAS